MSSWACLGLSSLQAGPLFCYCPEVHVPLLAIFTYVCLLRLQADFQKVSPGMGVCR